jgi:hypothetical protein
MAGTVAGVFYLPLMAFCTVGIDASSAIVDWPRHRTARAR